LTRRIRSFVRLFNVAAMSAPETVQPCAHDAYIEVTGRTKDSCHMSLRRQDDHARSAPLESRPHQTVTIPAYQDPEVASMRGYPPAVIGLGSCDSLAFRVCIQCHQVVGLEKRSLEEWTRVLTHVDEDMEE
jgi:hypothetical protein